MKDLDKLKKLPIKKLARKGPEKDLSAEEAVGLLKGPPLPEYSMDSDSQAIRQANANVPAPAQVFPITKKEVSTDEKTDLVREAAKGNRPLAVFGAVLLLVLVAVAYYISRQASFLLLALFLQIFLRHFVTWTKLDKMPYFPWAEEISRWLVMVATRLHGIFIGFIVMVEAITAQFFNAEVVDLAMLRDQVIVTGVSLVIVALIPLPLMQLAPFVVLIEKIVRAMTLPIPGVVKVVDPLRIGDFVPVVVYFALYFLIDTFLPLGPFRDG